MTYSQIKRYKAKQGAMVIGTMATHTQKNSGSSDIFATNFANLPVISPKQQALTYFTNEITKIGGINKRIIVRKIFIQ